LNIRKKPMQKRVAIYLRVSTSKRTLKINCVSDAWRTGRAGYWNIYEDAGISGAKGRDKRPGLERLMKAVNANNSIWSATWSVDRLGDR